MNKKELIIFTAARLIHEKGYGNVGIKSILDELDIPKGSFYHYFKSKEELGLAIIDIYLGDTASNLSKLDVSIDGLRGFFNVFFNRLIEMNLQKGCPIGNLILELSDEKETFRLKLLEWYKILEDWVVNMLISEGIQHPHEKAKILISAFEGTMLLAKLDKDPKHFDLFNEYTFDAILAIKK